MTINLIPVVEVEYGNQGVTSPEKYPYWNYSEIWAGYHEECCRRAGFTDPLIPYLTGSSFYKLSDISDDNLRKLVIDHTQEMRDGKYERREASTLFGGYVLQVDGQDKYFPQCCGDLSDIEFWSRLSRGEPSYSEGHPGPLVTFDAHNIVLNFKVREFDEPFQPTPPELTLAVDKSKLGIAVDAVKRELLIFQTRLEMINDQMNLGIENIGGLLIWDNGNYD